MRDAIVRYNPLGIAVLRRTLGVLDVRDVLGGAVRVDALLALAALLTAHTHAPAKRALQRVAAVHVFDVWVEFGEQTRAKKHFPITLQRYDRVK